MKWRLGLILFSMIWLCSCAYQFGYGNRKLPGGYAELSIPVFKNNTSFAGIEPYFTNALIREFESSKVARVIRRNRAPAYIERSVVEVEITPTAQVQGFTDITENNEDTNYLPGNTVLDTAYRVVVTTLLELRRSSDKAVLWKNTFKNESVYNAPIISVPGVNSANPLYNSSARHQNIELIAKEMMKDAHDRITERF